MDEPTVGFDPQTRDHIWKYIRELKEAEDITVVLTTHYMDEADRLSDRIAIMDHGKIVILDSPPKLKETLEGDVVAVKANNIDALSDLVTKWLGFEKKQIVDGALEITVRNGKAVMPRIMELATQNNIYVESIVLREPNLEDVFLTLYWKNNSGRFRQRTPWYGSYPKENNKMTEIRGFYTLWLREIKRFLRDRTRLVSMFIQPLLWLVIFGAGFGLRFAIPGLSYQQVIFPGIVGQTLLFTSMFMGISVLWDKEFGFMKEILVSPVSRFTIFIGKMVGDSTSSFIQGIMVFVIGIAIGVSIDPVTVIYALPIMLLITFGLVSIGLTIASLIGTLESLWRYPDIH